MVRVEVAGQPPSVPPAGPAPGPHDMYCSPYGEFYPPDHYFMPPPEMCPQPPHMCTMHGDYGPLMQMGGGQGAMGVPVQLVSQIVDESGQLRHVILSPQQPPPPPHHIQHTPPHHMQPPPHPSHPQQHYGPANGGPGNGPQQYYGPPGFPPPAPPPPNGPPPHYHPAHPHPHSHPHPHGPPLAPPPSHHHSMPPPHSPPHSYHKDERAQRQHVKLKKKLEQKQMRNDGLGSNSGYSTPALSPRKEFTNGVKSRSTGGSGSSMMGGTSSEGEGSSSAATSVQGDEEDSQLLLEYLSSLQTPQVSEVTARSALVQWSPPIQDPALPQLHTVELRYELLLGDKGRYKAIYSGPSLSCRVQDLRPGTEYSVCLQAHSEGTTGAASGAAIVRTPPCEPGTPPAPRTTQRTRSALQLRWHAPQDNGAPIQHYILQYDQGKGGEFVDLCKPRTKQHNLQKLEGSTCYRFRLAAVNEVGMSQWSDEVAFWTCGSPPLPPAAPILVRAYPNALLLRWAQRPGDEEFTLQIEDERTRHGYIPAYSGRETEARCEGLTRYSKYKFRLQAHNDEGGSRFSEEVIFRTLPENPSPPCKLAVKGKIHAHSFKVRWEPPGDRGGTDIQYYTLEIKSSGDFEPIYSGPEQEANCDRLQPGHTYRLRVSCTTAGGTSGWSEIQSVITDAVVPGVCLPPCLASQPRSNSIVLKWSKPEYDGGSPILEYNLEITDEEISSLVYKGKETECTVQELLPGRTYSFRLRAFNKSGGGPWSESFVAVSGAAPPETPLPPRAFAKSPYGVSVQWDEPPCNGGPITDYILEMSEKNEDSYFLIYQGLQNSFEVRNLIPFTLYYFRVSATNKAGQGEWSASQNVSTPAAVPASPLTLRVEAAALFATLFWQEPEDNGSPISHYRIDTGDKMLRTEGPILQFLLEDLTPASIYKVRVQAVNEIGIGNFSPTLKFDTLPLPPKPPQLECVQQGHNTLKLKWGDGKNSEQFEYLIEMQSPRRKDYQNVYRGTSLSFRVKKLQECTKYKFRICAISEAGGQGEFSEPEEYETAPAPPAPMKSLKLLEVTESTAHVDWSHHKIISEEPLTFVVQCCRTKDLEYKEVYKGTSMSTTIENLDSSCEYQTRVCAERIVEGVALQGSWSPILTLTTQAVELPASQSVVQSSASSPMANGTRRSARRAAYTPMTDDQWAALLIAGFIVIAVIFAIALQHFIDCPKSV